jgi:two-component system osmolarity sensor histidine kinase EnvZ
VLGARSFQPGQRRWHFDRGRAPSPRASTQNRTERAEIREANRSFNQMVRPQLVESDRALILAGISHDLHAAHRIPLELGWPLSADAREGLQSDIGQMDAIIGQFLDYAKPTEAASFVAVDISALLADVARAAERIPSMRVKSDIEPAVHVMGNETDLRRVFNNLVENARRYGATPGTGTTEIDISCHVKAGGGMKRALICLQDHGVGVPAGQIEQLLKPFTRMDTARGQANGAGLGLAIVERVVGRHSATLAVRNREGGGLQVELVMAMID